MRKKKVLWTVLVLVGLAAIGGCVYAYNFYSELEETASKIYEPIDKQKPNHREKEQDLRNRKGEPQPISILLLGVDERPNDRGRSDALIVMTLNPRTNTLQMISIPRDTRAKIVGRGTVEKINHAYAYGGTEMAMKTVEHFLDIQLHYYIKLDMQGLVDLVNAVGGITVYNDDSWIDPGYYKKGFHYHKGKLHLNGKQALGYVRMRYLPGGDFTRNEHQREVIKAIIEKAAGFSSLSHYRDILDAIADHVKTNLTFEKMKYIAMHYRDVRENIITYEMKGHTAMIDGLSYVIISEEEREKVSRMIQKQLGRLE